MIDRIFGRLTVLSYAGLDKFKKKMWLCRCECGAETAVNGARMRSGHTRSCGCLHMETVKRGRRVHGMTRSRAHSSWVQMHQRCSNPNHKNYDRYGKRGITVCARWNDFEQFLSDMGQPPEGMTIDRKDNNGNYDPENCRWATRKEQSRNTSRNLLITAFGKTQCVSEWVEQFPVSTAALLDRIHRGWEPEVAITKPMKEPKRAA